MTQRQITIALFIAGAILAGMLGWLTAPETPMSEQACNDLLDHAKASGEPDDYATAERHCPGMQ